MVCFSMAMGFILSMALNKEIMLSILMGCMLVLLLIFDHGSDEISHDDTDNEDNAGIESKAYPVHRVVPLRLEGPVLQMHCINLADLPAWFRLPSLPGR